MKKALKRSLSLLLAVAIIFSSAYVGLGEVNFNRVGVFLKKFMPDLSVETKSANADCLSFLQNKDGTYYVWDCDRYAEGELVIPSTYNGLPVTRIGYGAFGGCGRLTSITIPDSVTSIDERAFLNCDRLISITIPDSITSIGDDAFEYTYTFEVYISDIEAWCNIDFGNYYSNPSHGGSLYLHGKELRDVVIPDSITTIKDYTFYKCAWFESVVIPDSVTSIGKDAFYGCRYLTSITIPDSVTSIGDYAFQNCENLASITIPDSVTSIGINAFSGTAYLSDSSNWDGEVLYINNQLIKARQTITGEYVIRPGTKSIAGTAFYECKELTSVNISDSVMSIGAHAFQNCEKLASITIPDSVTSIGDYAFSGCTSLISITIPNSVTSMGGCVFSGCTSLTSITIPESVTSIGDYAISGCTSLTSVTIPGSVTSIGNCAFYDCTSLTSVTISDGVTSIGESAFEYCSSLTSITIPNSVTSIGDEAFECCSSLTSITLPDDVTIGQDVFSRTEYVSDSSNWDDECLYINNHLISVDASIKDAYTVKEGTKSIAGSAFYRCQRLTSVNIPDSVTSIGDYAFNTCANLESVSVGSGVTYIGEHAFDGREKFTTITVDSNNKAYSSEDGVLFNKNKTTLIQYPMAKTNKSYTIPDSVTHIKYHAFWFCNNLVSIVLPDSVTTIDNFGFWCCNALEYVYYCGTKSQRYNIDGGIGKSETSSVELTWVYNADDLGVDISQLSEDGITFFAYKSDSFDELSDLNMIDVYAQAAAKELTVSYDGKNKVINGNSFMVTDEDLEENTVTVSKKDFRDYIIPAAVGSTFGESDTMKLFMTKAIYDGKPYVSTVFGRVHNSDEPNAYVETQTNPVQVLNDIGIDVIISAVVPDGKTIKKYYLTQGDGREFSSIDGVFENVDMYSEFTGEKPIYAYVELTDGTKSDYVATLFNKTVTSDSAAQILAGTSFALLGSDGFKTTFPDDYPVIGGMETNIGFIEIPVGIQMENNKVLISLGFDFFKWEKETGDEEGSRKIGWAAFKESCKSLNQTVNDATDKMKTYRNTLTALQFGDFEPTTKKTFDGSFLGYIEAAIIDGELVATEVSGTIAAEFFMNFKQQFAAIGVVPFYAYVKGGATGSADIKGTNVLQSNDGSMMLTFSLGVEPSVRIGGGVGVKDAISAGFWGSGSLPTKFELPDKHLTMSISGKLGLEAEFFMLSSDVVLLDGTTSLVDKYFGSNSQQARMMYSLNPDNSNVFSVKTGEVKLVDRDYLENTSQWKGNTNKKHSSSRAYSVGVSRSVASESLEFTELQTSVYSNSQIQIVELDNYIVAAWIEDCAQRDTYNRFRLMYSVYDSANGQWSTPVPVNDNGKMDASPHLATDGTDIYVAWQNINYTFTEVNDNSCEILMNSAEIKAAKFNFETKSFDNIQSLTDNATYDYAPRVMVNDGTAEVCWVNTTANDYAPGTFSINKATLGSTSSVIYDNLNYVIDIDCSEKGISYIMDADGIGSTYDITVYEDGNAVPVSNSEIQASPIAIEYEKFNGETTLFAADDNDIYYIKDGVRTSVLTGQRGIHGNFEVTQANGETTILWSESVGNATEIFVVTYSNGTWSEPVQITDFGSLISNLSATMCNNELVALFNKTAITETTDDDGNISYENGATDICQIKTSGFTDISVSDLIVNEKDFIPGEKTSITFVAENKGMQPVETIVFEVTDTTGYSQVISETVNLGAGESAPVVLDYIAPEAGVTGTITVNAIADFDCNDANNIVSADFGKADLVMGDICIEKIGEAYIVTSVIKNQNNTVAENVWFKAYNGEESKETCFVQHIGTIGAGEQYEVTFCLKDEAISLHDAANFIYFEATTDTQETLVENNKAVTVIETSDIECTHKELEWNVTDPSCVTDGSTQKVCVQCGCVVETVVVAAPGHSYGEWVIDSEATCSSDGSKHKTCSACGEVETVNIVSSGHSYSTEWTIDVAATCTNNGSKSHHCSKCNSKTDVTVIASTGHVSSAWIVDIAATCEEDGYKYKECTECGEFIDGKDIPATGHSKGKWIVQDEPTCEYEGYKYKECAECGMFIDDATIPKKKHTVVVDEAVEPTCTKDGVTEGSHCSVCDNVIKMQEMVDAKGHKASGWIVAKKATVNAPGSKYRKCTVCGVKLKTAKIAQLKCSTPKLKSVINVATGIKFTWNKVIGADNYEIYRKTGSGSWTKIATVKGTITTYTDKTVKSGTTYKYTVKAKNEAGLSSYNTTGLSIKCLADPVLKNPTSTKSGITLKWNKVTGAQGYVVYRKTANGSFTKLATIKGISKVSYTDKKAKKGVKYSYKVNAYYGKTYSAYSNTKSIKDKY